MFNWFKRKSEEEQVNDYLSALLYKNSKAVKKPRSNEEIINELGITIASDRGCTEATEEIWKTSWDEYDARHTRWKEFVKKRDQELEEFITERRNGKIRL